MQPRGKPVRRGKHIAMVSAYADHPVWAWRERIVYEARKAAAGLKFSGAVCLSVLFVTRFVGKPKVKSTNPRVWHDAHKDLDNFIKPLKDALTEAGVWGDDGQIVTYGTVSKIRAAHGELPHTKVRIVEAPPVESLEEAWGS